MLRFMHPRVQMYACMLPPAAPIRVEAWSGAWVWRQVNSALLAGSRRTPVTPPHAAPRIGRAVERRLHLDRPPPLAAGAAGVSRRRVGPHAPRAVDEPHLG